MIKTLIVVSSVISPGSIMSHTRISKMLPSLGRPEICVVHRKIVHLDLKVFSSIERNLKAPFLSQTNT